MSRFKDKLILITGASSGIGRAAAEKLAREGATIIGVARNIERLEKALQKLSGKNHQAVKADATREEQLDTIIKIGKERGGFDGGVFCAGAHEMRPINLLSEKQLVEIFNANVTTAINCTKAVAKAVNPGGAGLVWLSSVAAIRGTPGFAAYACAKGAIISASKVAAIELARKKIRVNVILAGVVETPMSKSWLKLLSSEQLNKIADSHILGLGQPENITGAIAFLLSTDADWITGATLVVDGGLSIH